ncbi:MAG: MFS transporter [Pseudomonadota bacterium]
MLETLRSIASLLFSYGLLLVANGLFSTLLGVRARMEGFEATTTGLIMGAYFAGLLAGALGGSRVVASVGHIRSFAAFASLMSVTALLHAIWVDAYAWALLRFVAGCCMAGMIMVTESWLNNRTVNKIRGQILSIYMVTNYACAGLGQFLLPLSDPGEFYLFCMVSMFLSVALIPVLLTRAVAPPPSAPERGGFTQVFAQAPLGVLGAICAGAVNAAFNGMGPVYAQSLGLSVGQISSFMAAAILGGLLLQWPIGWLSDRVDRRNLLAGVALATACASLYLAGVEHHGAALISGAVIYGAVAFTVYSLSSAHANDRLGPEQSVKTASAMLVAYGCGAVAGPVVAGVSMGWFGPSGLFQQACAIMAGLGTYSVYRLLKRPEGAVRRPFLPKPGAQYTSDELYRAAREEADISEDPTVPGADLERSQRHS